MKINIPVRFKNPTFWINLAISILGILLAYFGLNWQEITTWSAFGELFVQAVQNPVVVFSVLACIYNAIIDPTTKGIWDSERAMTYIEPN